MINHNIRSLRVFAPALAILAACAGPTNPNNALTARGAQTFEIVISPGFDTLPQSTWIAKDVGVLPGDNQSAATAVSDNEGVVGWSRNGNGPYHGFLFQFHPLQQIPPLPGNADAIPTGVTNADHVVGNSDDRPFFWTDSTGTQPLPVIPGGWTLVVAGVNDFDEATGCAYPPDTSSEPYPHAVLWIGPTHTLKDLGPNLGTTNAGQCGIAINHSGQAALDEGEAGLVPTFGRYSPGRPIRTITGPPGGEASVAAINWSGWLAGQGLNVSGIGQNTFALVWNETDGYTIVPFFLGDSNNTANGINNDRVVVGVSNRNGSSCSHPWVWTYGDSTALLLPGLTGFHSGGTCTDNTSPAALNNGHEIVGVSPNASGMDHAVRWVKEPWQ